MVDPNSKQHQDAILAHLYEIAAAKRALLEIAMAIHDYFPAQAAVLMTMVRSLTTSADKLLGDTAVTENPL